MCLKRLFLASLLGAAALATPVQLTRRDEGWAERGIRQGLETCSGQQGDDMLGVPPRDDSSEASSNNGPKLAKPKLLPRTKSGGGGGGFGRAPRWNIPSGKDVPRSYRNLPPTDIAYQFGMIIGQCLCQKIGQVGFLPFVQVFKTFVPRNNNSYFLTKYLGCNNILTFKFFQSQWEAKNGNLELRPLEGRQALTSRWENECDAIAREAWKRQAASDDEGSAFQFAPVELPSVKTSWFPSWGSTTAMAGASTAIAGGLLGAIARNGAQGLTLLSKLF